ncbi:hypothetical protein PIB30_025246 [Stylosanthes scabra]|uniref:Uncharacterized protein n=1 Tax=Stylosanthes scabra TaxID=79078 RepID=A0ABU6SA40_9FABA|nr:hypothetical protein [Stylosanthes scabra]
MKLSSKTSSSALVGEFHPEKLRVRGTHSNKPLMIIINGGSTHNFVKESVAKKLGAPLTPTPTLQVMRQTLIAGSEFELPRVEEVAIEPSCNIEAILPDIAGEIEDTVEEIERVLAENTNVLVELT